MKIIKFEKISLFNYSIKNLKDLFIYSVRNDNYKLSISILKIFKVLHLNVMTEESYSTFEEKIVNMTINEFIKPLRFFNKDLNTVYESLKNLSNIIVNRLNNGKESDITESIECLFENTHFTITRDKENQHTELWMNLFFLSDEIMSSKNVQIINILLDQVDKTIKIALREKIEDPIFHCAYLIKSIEDKLGDEDCIKKMKERKFSYTLLVLDSFPEAAFLFMPKYKKIIVEATENNIEIDERINELNELFDKLIRIDRSPILYSFLNELNEILLELKMNNRINQEKIISIYKSILTESLILKSTENFKMILYKFRELIKELDSKSKMSEKLTVYIIDVLEKVSHYLVNLSSDNISKYYLSFITQLAQKTNSIARKKELKAKVILIIYRLTIEAIESKHHNLIRICSNSLGWYAKDLYDAGDYENFKVCIKDASSIYRIIDEMEYDVTLKIFIGTLFVILGSYLHGKNQQSLYPYVLGIAARLPDKELLQISKKLRESSGETWDQSLDIDSKQSMNKFISDLNKK